MLNIEKLAENKTLIYSVRKNLRLDEEDSSLDSVISEMDESLVMERFISWNNLGNMSGSNMIRVIELLKRSERNELLDVESLLQEDSSNVLINIKNRSGIEDDTEFLKFLKSLTMKEAFEHYLSWRGIIGYSSMILAAYETIISAKI